jgi:transaldolase
MSSQIWLDSANLIELEKWFKSGMIGGVTTNPVILQKEGVTDLPEHIKKMIEISRLSFRISIEIPTSEMSVDEMVDFAVKYARMFPENAVIKVPMDAENPTKAFEVIHILRYETRSDIKELRLDVETNATLGITSGQLIGAMEAGADFVSLFWGRCEEAGGVGALVTLKTVLKYREIHPYLTSRIIIGSLRSVDQIEKAILGGADIVTVKPELLEKWMFTQRGVETMNEFNNAYRSVKDKIKL